MSPTVQSRNLRFQMRTLSALVLALMHYGCASPPEPAATPTVADLVGIWKVDLRPTPDAEPYYQEFVVEKVDGTTFFGSFYGTPIESARVNIDWGQVHFAFTTSDGSGAYNTSGVLVGSQLKGTTHSIGRGFLNVWTAERTE